jgi:hypothetical protein
MRNNQRGQALIEFILIIPIFLILVFALIDFGNVLYKRYQLESDLDYIVDLYIQDQNYKIDSYVANKGLEISYEIVDQDVKIILTKKVNIMTPVLRTILNSPYTIRVERVIYDE